MCRANATIDEVICSERHEEQKDSIVPKAERVLAAVRCRAIGVLASVDKLPTLQIFRSE